MLAKFLTLILTFAFSQGLMAQLSENLDIYFSGGVSVPVESAIGKSFVFPQLDAITGTNFAQDILNLKAEVENFRNFWKPGLNIGGGMIYELTKNLSATMEFNYNNFNFDKTALQNEIAAAFQNPDILGLPFNENGLDIVRGSLHLYQITLNARIQYPAGFLRPYLTGGAGYLHINQESIEISYYDEPFPFQQGNISFYDQVPGQKDDVLLLNGTAGVVFSLSEKLQPFIQAGYNLGLTENDNTVYYPVRLGFVFTL